MRENQIGDNFLNVNDKSLYIVGVFFFLLNGILVYQQSPMVRCTDFNIIEAVVLYVSMFWRYCLKWLAPSWDVEPKQQFAFRLF